MTLVAVRGNPLALGSFAERQIDSRISEQRMNRILERSHSVVAEPRSSAPDHHVAMPAKVKAEQALHFAESLARGEPNRKKIVLTTIADQVRELI